jgi:hypothetical protein
VLPKRILSGVVTGGKMLCHQDAAGNLHLKRKSSVPQRGPSIPGEKTTVTEDLSLAAPGPRICQPFELVSASAIELTTRVATRPGFFTASPIPSCSTHPKQRIVVQGTFIRVLEHQQENEVPRSS